MVLLMVGVYSEDWEVWSYLFLRRIFISQRLLVILCFLYYYVFGVPQLGVNLLPCGTRRIVPWAAQQFFFFDEKI